MEQKDKYFNELRGLGYLDEDILDIDKSGVSIQTLEAIVNNSKNNVDDINLARAVYFGSFTIIAIEN